MKKKNETKSPCRNILFEYVPLFYQIFSHQWLWIYISLTCFALILPASIIRGKLVLKEFDPEYSSIRQYGNESSNFITNGFTYKFIENDTTYKRYQFAMNFVTRLVCDDIQWNSPYVYNKEKKSKIYQKDIPQPHYFAYVYAHPSGKNNTLFAITKDKAPSAFRLWLDIFSFLNFYKILLFFSFTIAPVLMGLSYSRFINYHERRRNDGYFNQTYEKRRETLLAFGHGKTSETYLPWAFFFFYMIL